MTIASELADQATSGIGSFKVSLFDYMGQLTTWQVLTGLQTFTSQNAQVIYDLREELYHD